VLSLGLTIFWFVTMLPFVLLLVPALIVATAHAFPSIVREDVRANQMKLPPQRLLGLSMLVPGIIMIVIALTITYASFGSYLSTGFAGYFPLATFTLIQLLLYAGGCSLSVLGGIFIVKKNTSLNSESS